MIERDHIDPVAGELICGLNVEENLHEITFAENRWKGNRFVPFRVCGFPAPHTFGDMAEFLIEGEWVVCEFGGKLWHQESNRIGNCFVRGGQNAPKNLEGCRLGGRISAEKNVASGQIIRAGQASRRANSKPVLATRLSDGHIFWFPALRRFAAAFPELNRRHLMKVANGERAEERGWIVEWFRD